MNTNQVQGVSKKSVILKFKFFGTFNDLIIKEIINAIINMIATRQLAIILAFVTLWEIKFDQMATFLEKGSRLQMLFNWSLQWFL